MKACDAESIRLATGFGGPPRYCDFAAGAAADPLSMGVTIASIAG